MGREGGDGFAPRGSSPPLGDVGQYYPRGDLYPNLPAGPLGGGEGGGDPEGGAGPPIVLQGLPLPMAMNGSLKGMALSIFNGNQ